MRTIEIDVRFVTGHVEGRATFVRVKQASGVTQRKGGRATVKAMRSMLRLLWKQPAHRHIVTDLARPVTDSRRRKLSDVYVAYVEGRLADLSPSFEDRALEPLIDEWLAEFQASSSHRHRYRQAFKQLQKGTRHTVKLTELPALLDAYRMRCVKKNTPRAFNYAKQGCNALLRDKVGKRHPLRGLIADIPKMTEAQDGVLGITVLEARAVRDRLAAMVHHPRDGRKQGTTEIGAEAARIWWAMCCTGMGPTEMWGSEDLKDPTEAWTVLADRIRIKGTKRPGRRWGTVGREVPRVVTPERPRMTADRFGKLVRRAGSSPYVGRHSFGCWMEDAEIPRTRRMMYLGHGATDVTGRYERREITQFLAEDRERLLKILGPETRLEMSKTTGLAYIPIAQEAG
jgi:hypothetical protein